MARPASEKLVPYYEKGFVGRKNGMLRDDAAPGWTKWSKDKRVAFVQGYVDADREELSNGKGTKK